MLRGEAMKLNSEFYSVDVNAGFRMDGYYVWCGSCVMGDDGRYYLFASRWPEETGFPSGYMIASEIVLASTDSLDKPFKFEKVIFSAREGAFWDSRMAHNPQIHKTNDGYLLFYIGSSDGSFETRKIGVAYSRSLTEGWVRPNKPIDLPPNANNPAAIVDDDGSVLLAFRDGSLKVSIAKAARFDSEYEVVAYDIFPKGRIEDMYLFKNDGRYEIIAEDNQGSYTGKVGAGVHFYSDDAISWRTCEPMQLYTRDVAYTDGSVVELQRRERPQLFCDGGDVYLFTTAKIDGETRSAGGKTWNMVVKMKAE